MNTLRFSNALGRLGSPLWGILASIGFVAATLVVLMYLDIHRQLVGGLHWVDAQGVWAALGNRELGRPPVAWAVSGGGFLATLFPVVYLTRIARRALARYAPGEPAGGVAE